MIEESRQIEKININMFPEDVVSISEYEKQKAKFIAEHKIYVRGYMKLDPVVGEAEWNKKYHSYENWRGKQRILTSYGHQVIIDKVNEIIEYLNK